MPDYQPQNPQPKKRYERQTPVFHVPTADKRIADYLDL